LILLDSDVFRHFHIGSQLSKLTLIYPGRICMPEIVKNELQKSTKLVAPVDDFISKHKIPVIPFPSDIETIKEYAYLTSKKLKGYGESACLAMARYHGYCIASSNIWDIQSYCKTYSIQYVKTMDILIAGNKAGILSVEKCNTFITDVKNAGSKLPVNSLQEFIQGKFPVLVI
jgi:hypothetical protein